MRACREAASSRRSPVRFRYLRFATRLSVPARIVRTLRRGDLWTLAEHGRDRGEIRPHSKPLRPRGRAPRAVLVRRARQLNAFFTLARSVAQVPGPWCLVLGPYLVLGRAWCLVVLGPWSCLVLSRAWSMVLGGTRPGRSPATP